MPMLAERDIFMANLSVCHTLELYRNECTYRLVEGMNRFLSAIAVTKF